MGKKKSGGKGKKEKKAKPVVDGVEVKEMSRPQLYGHCKRLQDEILKEIDERNRFMLERERYYLLWQLVMERVDEQKDKLDLLNSHMEDTLKDKDAQDADFKQKLRFLKSEQSKKLGQVRLYHLERMKLVQDDAWNLQLMMRDGLLAKKSAIRKAQMALFEIMRSLHLKHGKDLSEMRKRFFEEIRTLESTFNRRLFELNENEDEVQDEVLSQIDTIKEDQFKAMVYRHEVQMKDMKMFFNELTLSNLTLIAKMEIEVRLSKENEIRLRRQEAALAETLDSVSSPIKKCKDTMKEWDMIDEGLDAKEMEKDLKTLLRSKARLKRQAKMMEYSNEALLQRIAISEKERDELRTTFSHAIVDIQRKTSMRRLVVALQRKAAKREAELFNAVSSNLDNPNGDVDHYKQLLDRKDDKLRDVMDLVTEAATDYKTTYDIYSGAYQNNVIPLSEIGFPLTTSGARPREEEEKPIMVFDTKANNKRNRNIHGPTSTLPLEGTQGGTGSVMSEDASKSSMTSVSQPNSESHPNHKPSTNRARVKSELRTDRSRSKAYSIIAKGALPQKSKQAIVQAPSAATHSPVTDQPSSMENVQEKYIEHVRQRKMTQMRERGELIPEEFEQPKTAFRHPSHHHHHHHQDPPVVVLKSPPE